MSEEILRRLNARHFVTSIKGKTVVGTEKDTDGNPIDLQFSTFQSFREKYSNFTVAVKVGDGAKGKLVTKHMPMGKWWLNHPDRRQYDMVGYWPRGEKAPVRAFNLWRGFRVQAKKGDWSILQDHLYRNVARRDDALYQYIIQWMAFAVQKPAVPPGVALVMRGTKGSGKTSVANALGYLFGPHYQAIANSEQITGKFNAHLAELSLLLVDEGFWAGDKRNEGVLKQIITDPVLPIERKFFDMETAPNRLHIMMASNEGHVVPARGMERRFLVLDLDDKQAQDTVFFGAMHDQLKAGGYSGMLYDLLEQDIKSFDVRKAPRTQGLFEQMVHSFSPFEEWWYGKLNSGILLPTKKDWHRVVIKQLYDDYLEHVGARHPYNESRFALELQKWMPGKDQPRRFRGGSGEHRPWMYEFPELEKCKTEWERQHGISMPWGKETGE